MQNTSSITVIIPAYNEEENIGQVIDEIKNSGNLNEIIVVDNASTDKTAEIAQEHGARVVFCEDKGKGYAMEKGIKCVDTDIVLFIDGDLKIYNKEIIKDIINPITEEDFDFVKSAFEREGGRVTELVAKPLLELLFPNIAKFQQPLSGIIAGKTEYFRQIEFEKDYGVDIGILIDMINIGAKTKEVYIGKVDNNSKSWKFLPKMSREVAQAILKRANYIV